jgi:hypothetical protein
MNENAVSNRTRLAFADIGPVWRNNSGACFDQTGRLIRYGLANDSAKVNKRIKSSDLIGITPVTAYVASLGRWASLGVLTALETKPSGWVMRPGDDRAIAQARFHDIVKQAGGFAGFVTDPADITNIVIRG